MSKKSVEVIPEILQEDKLITPELTIDLDADQCTKPGWTVVEHQKLGKHNYSSLNPELYGVEKQKSGLIDEKKLPDVLKNQTLMNANLLDFYKEHPELIPKDWWGAIVFFAGTIYRDPNDYLWVRVLCLWGSDNFTPGMYPMTEIAKAGADVAVLGKSGD